MDTWFVIDKTFYNASSIDRIYINENQLELRLSSFGTGSVKVISAQTSEELQEMVTRIHDAVYATKVR